MHSRPSRTGSAKASGPSASLPCSRMRSAASSTRSRRGGCDQSPSGQAIHPQPRTAAQMRDPELDGFLALLATRRAPRTVEAYRRDLTHICARTGRTPGTTTPEDLRTSLAELRTDGLAPATISRRISAARAFFAHQVLLGATTVNTAAEMEASRS